MTVIPPCIPLLLNSLATITPPAEEFDQILFGDGPPRSDSDAEDDNAGQVLSHNACLQACMSHAYNACLVLLPAWANDCAPDLLLA